jgi:hypothetical protein
MHSEKNYKFIQLPIAKTNGISYYKTNDISFSGRL